jgi:hypothetical protein
MSVLDFIVKYDSVFLSLIAIVILIISLFFEKTVKAKIVTLVVLAVCLGSLIYFFWR